MNAIQHIVARYNTTLTSVDVEQLAKWHAERRPVEKLFDAARRAALFPPCLPYVAPGVFRRKGSKCLHTTTKCG